MPLTPEDVLNKTFGTTQFRRGYDEREVDDFLDEVVATMRRLTADLENCRNAKVTDSAPIPVSVDTGEWQARIDREVALRQEAERALGELQERHRRETDERIAAAAASGDGEQAAIDKHLMDVNLRADEAERAARERVEAANARADEAENAARQRASDAEAAERAMQERLSELEAKVTEAQSAASSAVAAAPPAPAPTDASGLIALAQRVHDEHVSEGQNTRERLVNEGQARHDELLAIAQRIHDERVGEATATHERLVTEGQSFHDELVGQAQARHEELLSTGQAEHDSLIADATEQSETMLRQAKEHAAQIVAAAQGQRDNILGSLEGQRQSLEMTIEELRAFESEYRAHLKGYLQEQLLELDTLSGTSMARVEVADA
ncbi:DivIVA domain-containing protein [Nostocoides jenkinsii]|jgi:DivIVA domain-containing protein|uniref:Cell wall synthesis protein Wag31 n=1 Tax=Nostocoides jenkinsii Ben 74 TaxID=1193518 RepID=A0A077MES3_9MICO|nr:DivIVA domain-containing protein [Tetrasphaera jenkinsii]CCI53507.1 putative Wag31 [Tetrasphaera jenkinsii Ben 74]